MMVPMNFTQLSLLTRLTSTTASLVTAAVLYEPVLSFAQDAIVSDSAAIQGLTEPTAGTNPDFTVAECGQDYAVYRRLRVSADPDGMVSLQTNQFTLLETILTTWRMGNGD
jgi:hypothetical protein